MSDAYAAAVDAMRVFQDRVVGSRPSDGELQQLTRDLCNWSKRLADVATDEATQFSGNRHDLPSRGRIMVPPAVTTTLDEQQFRGSVTFGRYYLGANSAAHGGAIALLFDEVLGRLANFNVLGIGNMRVRTAFLNTNFRSITPIDRALDIRARVNARDGRKRFLQGELWHGDVLCADANALFIELKRGQP